MSSEARQHGRRVVCTNLNAHTHTSTHTHARTHMDVSRVVCTQRAEQATGAAYLIRTKTMGRSTSKQPGTVNSIQRTKDNDLQSHTNAHTGHIIHNSHTHSVVSVASTPLSNSQCTFSPANPVSRNSAAAAAASLAERCAAGCCVRCCVALCVWNCVYSAGC